MKWLTLVTRLSAASSRLVDLVRRPDRVDRVDSGPRASDEDTGLVFLSYNRADSTLVHKLKALLTERHVSCWMDDERVAPGDSWMTRVGEGITGCQVALAIFGPRGPGRAHEAEMQTLVAHALDGRLHVIPVFLPGRYEVTLPPLLESRVYVDMRGGFSPELIEQLVWGIRRERRSPPIGFAADRREVTDAPGPPIAYLPRVPLEEAIESVCVPSMPAPAVRIVHGDSGVGKTAAVSSVYNRLNPGGEHDWVWIDCRLTYRRPARLEPLRGDSPKTENGPRPLFVFDNLNSLNHPAMREDWFEPIRAGTAAAIVVTRDTSVRDELRRMFAIGNRAQLAVEVRNFSEEEVDDFLARTLPDDCSLLPRCRRCARLHSALRLFFRFSPLSAAEVA